MLEWPLPFKSTYLQKHLSIKNLKFLELKIGINRIINKENFWDFLSKSFFFVPNTWKRMFIKILAQYL